MLPPLDAEQGITTGLSQAFKQQMRGGKSGKNVKVAMR